LYTLKSDFKTVLDYYEKLIKFEAYNSKGYFGPAKSYFELKEYEKSIYIKSSEQIMGAMYQQPKAVNKKVLFVKIEKK
jgi:hypothetical protein